LLLPEDLLGFFTHLPFFFTKPFLHFMGFAFGFTAGFVADGAAKFPPGAWETLPGTNNGAGFVNGPWHASPEHGARDAGGDGKPPPRRAS
jgi:hypothetical protein